MTTNSKSLIIATLVAVGLMTVPSAALAANATANYTGGSTGDISLGTNFSTTPTEPGVANDVVFGGTTALGSLVLANSSVDFGSFDDTDSAAVALTLNSSNTLTLGGSGDLGNAVAPNASDLLYLKTSTLGISGAGTLAIGAASGGGIGNIDVTGGPATITSVVTTGNGLGFTQTGTGQLVFGASGSLGSTTNGAITTGTGTTTFNNQSTGTGTSKYDYFYGAIMINGNLVIENNSTTAEFIEGGITGTGNVTLNNNSSSNYLQSLSNAINNSGTLTITGTPTSGDTAYIAGGIGSNVTAITNSSSGELNILTTGISVNSGGTTITNSSGTTVITGGISGTGNLLLNNNSSTANAINIGTTSVNNTGTVTNSGTGSGNVLVSSVVGGNVTGVVQNSATSALSLSGANLYTGGTTIDAGTLTILTSTTALSSGTLYLGAPGSAAATFNDDVNATVTNNIVLGSTSGTLTIGIAAASNSNLSGTVTGSNNFQTNRTSNGSFTFSGLVNNAGTITDVSTYNGANGIEVFSGGIGSNVTAINENGATAPGATNFFASLQITGSLAVNAAGTSINGNSTAGGIFLSGGVTGTGNLTFNANTSQAITAKTVSVNNAGKVINSGSGSGATTISAVIGTNVTGVTQNSTTSSLTLSGANTYTGATTVTAGSLIAGIAADAYGTNSAVSVASGASLIDSTTTGMTTVEYNETIGSLSGAGTVALGGTTLTTGGNNTSANFSGTATGTTDTLVKNGTGAQLFTGQTSFNTVNVNAGSIGGAGGTITTTGVTVAAGGGLNVSGAGTTVAVTAGQLKFQLSSTFTQTVDLSAITSGALTFALNTPTTSDSVLVAGGTLNFGTGANSLSLADFNFVSSGSVTVGNYVLFDTDALGAITGNVNSSFGTVDGFTAQLIEGTDASNNADVYLTLTAAPEPSTYTFLLLGLGGLAFLARRRRTSTES